jgi:hypothetical protein
MLYRLARWACHVGRGEFDVQAHKVADLDRRLGQIDAITRRWPRGGGPNASIQRDRRRRLRCSLTSETAKLLSPAAIKSERASVAAKGREIDGSRTDPPTWAEVVGDDTDGGAGNPVVDCLSWCSAVNRSPLR